MREKGRRIVSSAIEHPAVLDTLRYLEKEGADVVLLPVDRQGVVNIDALQAAISDDTILISVMFANEVGTIQPIKEIGAIAKERGVLFHVDAAQAVGYEAVDVYDLNVDLMSFSAHKFYGPKGIGGLFVRSFSPMVRLDPVMFGGGQERTLWPGTLNVPSIVGMAEALAIADKEQKQTKERMVEVAAAITCGLQHAFPDITLNGHPKARLAHNLSLSIPGVEAKALIHVLRDKLSFSAGSACSTTKVEPSYVLKAIGLSDDDSFQTIRLGLGRNIANPDEIVQLLLCAVRQLKR